MIKQEMQFIKHLTNSWIIEYFRKPSVGISPSYFPGVKEPFPVNVRNELGDRNVTENFCSQKTWFCCVEISPIYFQGSASGSFKAKIFSFQKIVVMILSNILIFIINIFHKLFCSRCVEKTRYLSLQ